MEILFRLPWHHCKVHLRWLVGSHCTLYYRLMDGRKNSVIIITRVMYDVCSLRLLEFSTGFVQIERVLELVTVGQTMDNMVDLSLHLIWRSLGSNLCWHICGLEWMWWSNFHRVYQSFVRQVLCWYQILSEETPLLEHLIQCTRCVHDAYRKLLTFWKENLSWRQLARLRSVYTYIVFWLLRLCIGCSDTLHMDHSNVQNQG